MARHISYLLLGLCLTAFYEHAEATQVTMLPNPLSQECLSQLAKIKPPLPTIEDMLNVNPAQTPWGINLKLVEEFNHRFRNTSGLSDECNIAPRITNYQNNLSDLKKAEIIMPVIQEMIDNVNLDADTSLKRSAASKKSKKEKAKEQQQIEHDKEVALKPLLERMDKLKRAQALAKIGLDKTKNNYKMMLALGLTNQQIAKLPDRDTWKAMQQEEQQALAPTRPKTPTPAKRNLSFPPNRSLPPTPQTNSNF
jgi:hypothetical protein